MRPSELLDKDRIKDGKGKAAGTKCDHQHDEGDQEQGPTFQALLGLVWSLRWQHC
jgi:hypothetical protein